MEMESLEYNNMQIWRYPVVSVIVFWIQEQMHGWLFFLFFIFLWMDGWIQGMDLIAVHFVFTGANKQSLA